MRKTIVAIAATAGALLALPALAFPPMPDVQSEVFQAAGAQVEIAKRGEICIARIVRFDGVSIADATNGTGPLSGALDNPLRAKGKTGQVAGGNVIITSSPELGIVVANNRLPYTMTMLSGVFQSTLTLEAKDGRFRITHSMIQEASKNTGIMSNEGLKPVNDNTKLAKRATEELQNESRAIAACMTKPSDF